MKNSILETIEGQLQKDGILRTPTSPVEAPPFFYYNEKYFYEDANGIYHPMNEVSLRRWLKDGGYEIEVEEKLTCSPYIKIIQDRNAVTFATALAGYKAGRLRLPNGEQILVTRSSSCVQPEKGDWSAIRQLIEGMFDSGGLVQSIYLYGWLKVFLEAFRSQLEADVVLENISQGQCMVIVGPRDSGKSFFVASVLVPMFGGRVAKPFSYMSKKTDFNGEVAGAPLLLIDDEPGISDRGSRSSFGDSLKDFCVNQQVRIHAKHKEPVVLKPCQRVIICANDEADHITVLPTMSDSMTDKLMLFKVRKSLLLASAKDEDRVTIPARLKSELPAFVDYLLHEFVIPNELKSTRMGITHFRHPDIVQLLRDVDPDTQLMEAIDAFVKADIEARASWTKQGAHWEGTANQLEQSLRTELPYYVGDRLFRSSNSLGMALSRLSKSYPERVQSRPLLNGTKRWRITCPEALQDGKAVG